MLAGGTLAKLKTQSKYQTFHNHTNYFSDKFSYNHLFDGNKKRL